MCGEEPGNIIRELVTRKGNLELTHAVDDSRLLIAACRNAFGARRVACDVFDLSLQPVPLLNQVDELDLLGLDVFVAFADHVRSGVGQIRAEPIVPLDGRNRAKHDQTKDDDGVEEGRCWPPSKDVALAFHDTPCPFQDGTRCSLVDEHGKTMQLPRSLLSCAHQFVFQSC